VSGIFVPAAAAMLGQPIVVPADVFFVALVIWTVIGGILHYESRRVIATVRE
jgi:hypothetical protein